MLQSSIQKYWHKLFALGVVAKGFNGVWETASGLLVLFLNKATLSGWFYRISRNELLEDPNDKFIGFLAGLMENFSVDAKTFAALYLLFHGLLNIFLAIQLRRDRHWAYLATITTMSVAMTYQIYRIFLFHSQILAWVTVFDALFIILIWHEYRFHRKESGI